jgi:hypothetical protein
MSTTPPLKGCLAALVFVCAASAGASPLITEFLASNNTGLQDEDNTFQDWIEIYNPDAVPLDLSGYHLTDDSANPTRWTFPTGVSLAPGQYLVIFASNKDRRVPGQNLHTNFALSVNGEFVGIYAPGGAGPALSSFTFGQQTADVSYGLLNPVAGSPEASFTVPTPGAPNNSTNAPAPPVQFGPLSQTFNQGTSLQVALTTSSPTATIRYTTNLGKPLAVEGIMGTFTANATTDELTLTAHGFSQNDEVQIEGTSIAGLGQSLVYFVLVQGPNVIKLSDEPGGLPTDVTANTSITLRRDAARFTASVGGLCTSAYHTFYDRDPVRVTTTGTLPGGLAAGTTYYVSITPSTPRNFNNYRLAATPGGATLNLSSAGTGVHTITLQPSAVYAAPITVNSSQRIRARAYETGRPDGPIGSETYLALDAAAQTFTSSIPIMILHSWGSNHPSSTAPGAGTPEDTKEAVWFVFEPKLEGTILVARMTNPPDLVTPAYFERRGSSTFGAAKYSMSMGALNESGTGTQVSPLGFASNDDFVLNAPYQFDLSLIHNDLIYRLSNEIGRYAPRTQHVEMFMSVNNEVAASGGNPAWGYVNGASTSADYYGVYSFQDRISRGQNRVDVEDLNPEDNAPPEVQGGYIFKIDRLDAGDSGLGAGGRTFALVQPKEWTSYPSHLQVMTNQQKSYLQGVLNSMYSAVTGPNFMSPTLGYQAHLDVPACIDHWWLSVLPKSADAFRLSGYWHKSRYGKLVMGPIFDFDRAMGSADQRDWIPTTWRGDVPDYGTDYFHNAGIYSPNYFHWMFNDPNYWQAVIDRYEELRQGTLSTASVHGLIDAYAEQLDPGNSFVNPALTTAARRNQQKWGGPRNSAQFPGTNGHFRGEIQWLKNWWGKATPAGNNGRFDFIDGQFMRPPAGSAPAGPVAAGTPISLSSTSQSIPGVKIYYTLDGSDPRAAATAPLTLFTPGTLTTLATILPDISTVRAIVPTSTATGGATDVEWRGADTNGNGNNADDFDDSAWFTNAAGTVNGIGYDNAPDYLPYISVRWSTPTSPVPPNNSTNTMFNVNGSCYGRWAFNVTPADLALLAGSQLTLSLRFDDSVIVWINGTQVYSSDNLTAAWNTVWSAGNREATNPPTNINLTASANLLHSGTNLLAIQGINGSNTGSSDFIVQPKLLIQGTGAARPAYTPELTAGAVQYTAPLVITAPTQITARTLHPLLASDPPTATTAPAPTDGGPVPNGSSWSAPTRLYYFPGAAEASQANIQITEVHYHPSAPTAEEIAQGWLDANDFEYVRLTNTGPLPVDLTGIFFSDGVEFKAAPGLQNWLPGGASILVVENPAAFTYRYGSSFVVLGAYGGNFNDAGERVTLRDKNGVIISDFTYGDDPPWPDEADEAGHSLLYVGGDQNLPASWQASAQPGGTAINSFAAWQRGYFTPAEIPSAGMSADNDGDALNNLGEYAFVTHPRTAGPVEAATGVPADGSPPGITFVRRSGIWDVRWVLESSNSLSGPWTPVYTAPSVTSNGDGTETVVWRLGSVPLDSRLFLRVQATNP